MPWSSIKSNDMFKLMYEHDIWNGITLYARYDVYFEVYGFSSSRNNDKILEFYSNNLKILKEFISYFKEQFHEELLVAEKQVFMTLPTLEIRKYEFYTSSNIIQGNLDDSNILFPVKKYYSRKNNKVYLTKREFEILSKFSNGLSMKEIAIEINVKPRTVEQNLNNIKLKSNTHFKSELIKFFKDEIEI